MNVIIYQTAKEFLQENEPILLEKEAVSQLILYNAMENNQKKQARYYYLE